MALTPEASKQARAQLGLSQRQAAERAGIARVQLSLFEVGKAVHPNTPHQLTRFYQERNAMPPMPVSSEDQNGAVPNEQPPDSKPAEPVTDTETIAASCFTVTDAHPYEADLPEPPHESVRDSSYGTTPGWLTGVAITVLAFVVAVLLKGSGGNPAGVTPIYPRPFDR